MRLRVLRDLVLEHTGEQPVCGSCAFWTPETRLCVARLIQTDPGGLCGRWKAADEPVGAEPLLRCPSGGRCRWKPFAEPPCGALWCELVRALGGDHESGRKTANPK